MKHAQYTADMIKVLSTPEMIRSRPAMYMGAITDPLVASRMLQESLCLALDSACCGAGTNILVTLHRDGSATVIDDGPGLSLKPSPDGRPEAELLMTELFACRDRKANKALGSEPCQFGIAAMNALSEWCVLTTSYEGCRWRQEYRAGTPRGPFAKVDNNASTGTTISFKPDSSIWTHLDFDVAVFIEWARQLELPLDFGSLRLADERTGINALLRPIT